MTEGELSQLMTTLVEMHDLDDSSEVSESCKEMSLVSMKTYLPEQISSDVFVEKILGFGSLESKEDR